MNHSSFFISSGIGCQQPSSSRFRHRAKMEKIGPRWETVSVYSVDQSGRTFQRCRENGCYEKEPMKKENNFFIQLWIDPLFVVNDLLSIDEIHFQTGHHKRNVDKPQRIAVCQQLQTCISNGFTNRLIGVKPTQTFFSEPRR